MNGPDDETAAQWHVPARVYGGDMDAVRNQVWRFRPSLGDDEVAHHGHVFVFEVVAVEYVASFVAVESDGDGGVFEGSEIDGVFPADVVGAGFAVASR